MANMQREKMQKGQHFECSCGCDIEVLVPCTCEQVQEMICTCGKPMRLKAAVNR